MWGAAPPDPAMEGSPRGNAMSSNPADWLNRDALADMLRGACGEYAVVVADSLAEFVRLLSSDRLDAIGRAMPVNADLLTSLLVLIHECPTLHKLAQVVARHRHLPVPLRSALQTMESLTPRTPLTEIQQSVRRELGATADELQLGDGLLAEGSVAAVVPFQVVGGSRQAGVLKVLKAGVADRLDEDLAAIEKVAGFFEDDCRRRALEPLPIADTLETVRELLYGEIRLDNEQAHLSAARQAWSSHRDVVIPQLLPFSTPRMTAMERVHGRLVSEINDLGPAQRRRLAELVAEGVLAAPVWSGSDRALFHADPHGGNLMFVQDHPHADPRLALLDWSLVGRLGKHERVEILQIAVGGITLDERRIRSGLHSLATSTGSMSAIDDAARYALGLVRAGRLPGLSWVASILDRAAHNGARFSSDLLLFRKATLTVEGILHDIHPDVGADATLLTTGLRQLVAEWPARWITSPLDRRFGSHVANADLLHVLLAMPAATMNLWLGQWSAWCGQWAATSGAEVRA